APGNAGRCRAGITDWSPADFFDSQFFAHLSDSLRLRGRSYATDEKLLDIIVSRAGYSLAIQLPALGLGWVLGMILSCFVAYYHDTWIDRAGVFLSVLGMCVPYLAYMILGQWVMFQLYPPAAWGLSSPVNIYVPVLIAVVAGLGQDVRFYRTIILDEIHRDYVRTARAKGVPLPGILFRHVLKNCMLPILTNLVTAIPFLILGSLLLERFFGVPGLGDLMVSSITSRDVPIMTDLTFLTAVVYVLGLLITDILYAVFDPRVRLR
ncbi:MAG TPA: ABC transporter permease, partial [Phycisphaerae bacterium]|nr:ABC transporter permease [Phycisphaerae bacterium]